MPSKISILIFLALLCSALVSCGRADSRLRDVDSIMESDPETALEQLQQIQPAALSESDYAYYALLYTQAQDKCDVINTSDSLIKVAYEKYNACGNGNLKMHANFYKAVVDFYRKDYRAAMKYAIAAYDVAHDIKDPYWIAKTAEMLADIFYNVYNYSQAELYTQEAIEQYLLAGRIDNHRYALCDLATVYLREDRLDDAKTLTDSLYEVVSRENPVDSALLDYMSIPMSSVLLRSSDLEELDSLLHATSDLDFGIDDNVNVSVMKSIISFNNGDTEEASTILTDAYNMSDDDRIRVQAKYEMYRQHIKAGNYEQAAFLADSLIRIQSRIAEEVLSESVTGEQSDFYSKKADRQRRQAEMWLYAFIVAVIMAVFIFIIYKLKIRSNRAEFEANLASLMAYGDRKGTENGRLENELRQLFHEKWTTLNLLCQEYYNLGTFEKGRAMIVQNIEAELVKLKAEDNLKDIERAVDKYMGNIMSLLRAECTFLSKKDFVFLSLLFAGLSSRSVCVLLDIKYSYYYVKRDRIKERIAKSDASHKDIFMANIR